MHWDWRCELSFVDSLSAQNVVCGGAMGSLVRPQWFGMIGRTDRGMVAAECTEVCRLDPGCQKGESALRTYRESKSWTLRKRHTSGDITESWGWYLESRTDSSSEWSWTWRVSAFAISRVGGVLYFRPKIAMGLNRSRDSGVFNAQRSHPRRCLLAD